MTKILKISTIFASTLLSSGYARATANDCASATYTEKANYMMTIERNLEGVVTFTNSCLNRVKILAIVSCGEKADLKKTILLNAGESKIWNFNTTSYSQINCYISYQESIEYIDRSQKETITATQSPLEIRTDSQPPASPPSQTQKTSPPTLLPKPKPAYDSNVFLSCKSNISDDFKYLPSDCALYASPQANDCREVKKEIDAYCLGKAVNDPNAYQHLTRASAILSAIRTRAEATMNQGTRPTERPRTSIEPSRSGWTISADLRSNNCPGRDRIFIVQNDDVATDVVCGTRINFPNYCKGRGMHFSEKNGDMGCVK